jgi:hypothetical protein
MAIPIDFLIAMSQIWNLATLEKRNTGESVVLANLDSRGITKLSNNQSSLSCSIFRPPSTVVSMFVDAWSGLAIQPSQGESH